MAVKYQCEIIFYFMSIWLLLNSVHIAAQSVTTDRSENTPLESNNTKVSSKCDVRLNKIIGNIYFLQHDDLKALTSSLMSTRILVNHGQYIGYPYEDGSFEIDDLPPDSYVVEVTHPKYIYEPFRVDITVRGKIRARRVNHIQPSIVQTVDYPLKFMPKNLHNYFIPRETWRIMDLLFNPMVIMMVVPLVIIWLLPKMINPQEAQAQRESMPEYNVPELSEMMANMFGQQRPSPEGQAAIGQAGSSSGPTQRHNKPKRR